MRVGGSNIPEMPKLSEKLKKTPILKFFKNFKNLNLKN